MMEHPGYRLPPKTAIGYVHLQVSDMERTLGFYVGMLGFRQVHRKEKTVWLSPTGDAPGCILLTEVPGAIPKPPHTTGLYHVAIRFPHRRALGQVFRRLVDRGWRFQGFSDHGVSEAIYLADPDGNGLELYRDRPREQWPREGDQIAMVTRPLDVRSLLVEGEEVASEGQIHPETDIGHVHLQVADLAGAEDFYHRRLGLEVTQRSYPGALFFAAGGYHHHVGTNIWAGRGAPPPPSHATGLRYFTLRLPDAAALTTLEAQLRATGTAYLGERQTLLLRDPSGNAVAVTAQDAPDVVEALFLQLSHAG
ncbi:MAG: VOC family protein [Calditrichaeota bacterium]|nr:MAG: VOC family protein [Calditrichota bacterium]